MLSAIELRRLRRACDQLDDGPDHRCPGYVPNLMLTVLNFQTRTETVSAAFDYFEATHGISTHEDLKALLARFPDTPRGNLRLARCLWNNNHWSRAQFLRVLVAGLEARGVHDQKSLKAWLKRADFERDVKGQFRAPFHSVGYALFHWLQLRLGIDTIKPDSMSSGSCRRPLAARLPRKKRCRD